VERYGVYSKAILQDLPEVFRKAAVDGALIDEGLAAAATGSCRMAIKA
jgi:hypothetical protein